MNVPIRVFDTNLNLLGEVDDYIQASFTRRWHSPGEFEISINTHSPNAALLQKNNIIMFGSDVYLSGIIRHREVVLGESGKASENWIVKGYSLGGITKQRLVIPPFGNDQWVLTSNVENVMRQLVISCFISTSLERIWDILQVLPGQNQGNTVTHRSRYKVLADDLEALSVFSGMGWEIIPNFQYREAHFEVFSGVDKTYGQAVNPPVIFSPEFDVIRHQQFRDSDLGMKNSIYVAGQGEGASRAIELVTRGTPEGINRTEHFQDARDLSTTQELITRGQQKLQEFDTEKIFEATINEFGPFKYRQDWDLGDLVTIQNKAWGETMDARIISVTEAFTTQGRSVNIGLGSQYPNLIAQLKRKFENFDNEIRR